MTHVTSTHNGYATLQSATSSETSVKSTDATPSLSRPPGEHPPAQQKRTGIVRISTGPLAETLGPLSLSGIDRANDTLRKPSSAYLTEEIRHRNTAVRQAALSPARKEYCERALAELQHHKAMIVDCMRNGCQAEAQYGDRTCLPFLIEAQNARTPNLNLLYLDSMFALGEHIQGGGKGPIHQRALVRAHQPDNTTYHHFAVDIFQEHGSASLIAIDTVNQSALSLSTWAMLNERRGQVVVKSLLVTETQNSGVDCIIFGLSHAKKMADEAPRFVGWHRLQLAGKAITEGEKNIACGFDIYVHGHEMLPLAFSKHVQSSTVLRKIIAKRSDAEQPVNKAGQTLAQRFESKTVTRRADDRALTYSASIEFKRQLFIDQAIHYFEATLKQSALG